MYSAWAQSSNQETWNIDTVSLKRQQKLHDIIVYNKIWSEKKLKINKKTIDFYVLDSGQQDPQWQFIVHSVYILFQKSQRISKQQYREFTH